MHKFEIGKTSTQKMTDKWQQFIYVQGSIQLKQTFEF